MPEQEDFSNASPFLQCVSTAEIKQSRSLGSCVIRSFDMQVRAPRGQGICHWAVLSVGAIKTYI